MDTIRMQSPDPYAIRTGEDQGAANRRALVASLGNHPFLNGLSEAQLRLLAENAMAVEFGAGDLIFQEGDNANRFYLIQEGEVILETVTEKSDKAVTIDVLGAGEVLGWSWLFPPYYWHFDARALTPTKAIFFYATRLREECEKDPALGFALALRVAEVTIRRLQSTRHRLAERVQSSS